MSLQHLRSDEFLNSFQKYLDGIIDINTYAKRMGYFPALSLLDDYIDNSLKSLSTASKSSIFLSKPYEIIQENDDTRLLRYYYYQAEKGKQEEEQEDDKKSSNQNKLLAQNANSNTKHLCLWYMSLLIATIY